MTRGVRALLLDLDGTIYQDGALIPGVKEALSRLGERGIALRFVTNTTSRPRAVLADELAAFGLAIPPELIFTPVCAARELLLSRDLTRCLLVVNDSLIPELDGIERVEEDADAVVMGDVGPGFTYDRLNAAFRALVQGAELVALAKNRYFRSSGRLVLDVGPFVAGLEYATGHKAIVVGKPSPEFFRLALADLGLPPSEVAVVGDDLEGDVGGAHAANMRGILVKTGKFRAGLTPDTAVRPDAVLDSLAEIERVL